MLCIDESIDDIDVPHSLLDPGSHLEIFGRILAPSGEKSARILDANGFIPWKSLVSMAARQYQFS